MKKESEELICSFCGRSSREVAVIPGVEGNICVDCVKHAHSMVERHEKQANAAPPLPPTPSPKEIKEFLDQFVIGHDETKKVLAVAVHNHYRRLEASEKAAKENLAAVLEAILHGMDMLFADGSTDHDHEHHHHHHDHDHAEHS